MTSDAARKADGTPSRGGCEGTPPWQNCAVGTLDKPPAQTSRPAARPGNAVSAAVRETASDAIKKEVFEKRPYLKLAFANPYNLSLLLGSVAASVLTANPIPALLAFGGEALWLLHGPDSGTLRRLLWDPRLEKVRLAVEQQERAERMKDLSDEERNRVEQLVARQQQINHLASVNPTFTGELLRTELAKMHRLIGSFLELTLTCSRYESYLNSVDVNSLDRDRQRWQQRSDSEKTPAAEREIAKKNLAVILKRIDKLREIRNYLGVARAQLDLIENSFQLISDQIVTMESPTQLSGQLDDLLDGVDSVRQTAIDTEKILNGAEA